MMIFRSRLSTWWAPSRKPSKKQQRWQRDNWRRGEAEKGRYGDEKRAYHQSFAIYHPVTPSPFLPVLTNQTLNYRDHGATVTTRCRDARAAGAFGSGRYSHYSRLEW